MKLVSILAVLLLVMEAAAAEVNNKEELSRADDLDGGCSQRNPYGQCTTSGAVKSRKKRLVTLPNATSFVLQSRLTVPQPPVGLYLVWVRVRFFIRAMFTETTIST